MSDSSKTFSKMVWQEAVRRCRDVPAAQRLVILHVGATADQSGRNAWRANNLVATELGVSLDTVKRARTAAIEMSLMVVTRPAPRGAGNTKTAEYRLTLPGVDRTADDLGNGGSPAPISAEEIGAAESGNRCKNRQEIGAAGVHPSGLSSGLSSGGLRKSGTSPGAAGPDPIPTPRASGNGKPAASASATLLPSWSRGPYGPRCRDHVNDAVAPKCGGCRDADKAAKADDEAAANAQRIAAKAIRDDIDDCGDCDESGRLVTDWHTDCPNHANFRSARVS